jgi:hypothetical protein
MYKLSHGWLLVDDRESRCGATTDICPQCNQPETFPTCTSARPVQLGVISLSLDSLKPPTPQPTCAAWVSRTGFSLATRMILLPQILFCSNRLVPSSQRLHTTEVEYPAAGFLPKSRKGGKYKAGEQCFPRQPHSLERSVCSGTRTWRRQSK